MCSSTSIGIIMIDAETLEIPNGEAPERAPRCNHVMDYNPIVDKTFEDIAEGRAVEAFRLEKQKVGKRHYTVVGYRSPRLRDCFCTLIMFIVNENGENRLDFIARHNWFSSDDAIKKTISLFFKAYNATQIKILIEQAKQAGFIRMHNDSDLALLKNGGQPSESRPDLRKVFVIVRK